jgi:hypothetical protein
MTRDSAQTVWPRPNLRRFQRGFFAASVVAALPLAVSAGSYDFQPINVQGDNFTQLLGVNNATTIAGYHGANLNQGFVLTPPSTFTMENFPGSAQTQVVGINNNGDTAGFFIDTGGVTHGFEKIGATFSTVDAPGTAFTQILGINDNQVLAGYSSQDAGGANPQTAFVMTPDKVFHILTSALNGLGSQSAQATGVNNNLGVTGFYIDGLNVTHGFFLPGLSQTPVTIDLQGATFTQALGLNNLGEIVGDYIDAGGKMHGFLDNNGVFQTIDDPQGIGTTTINGINDKGQLVGFFVDANNATEGFLASPTPDSCATSGLLILTLAALAVWRPGQHRSHG